MLAVTVMWHSSYTGCSVHMHSRDSIDFDQKEGRQDRSKSTVPGTSLFRIKSGGIEPAT